MRTEPPEPDRPGTAPPGGGCSGSTPRGPLIVVSGPTAVGKTTVVDRLLTQTKLPLRRAVTATTRQKRDGEVDGQSYHFWSVPDFRRAIDEGRMLESEIVHGIDHYGTPRSELDCRGKGMGVILVIDVKGAAKIRKLFPGDYLSVFINAPFEDLERRILARGTETQERIQRRLETARSEVARAGEFDHVIVNRDLDQAVRELEVVIATQFTQRDVRCSTS